MTDQPTPPSSLDEARHWNRPLRETLEQFGRDYMDCSTRLGKPEISLDSIERWFAMRDTRLIAAARAEVIREVEAEMRAMFNLEINRWPAGHAFLSHLIALKYRAEGRLRSLSQGGEK